MFRDRNEELTHLIELYEQDTKAINAEGEEDQSQNKNEAEIPRSEIESFASIMISNMLLDKDLDSKFANKLFEFDPQLFSKIFKDAIQSSYSQIGFNKTLKIVNEVKYFGQAISGYSAIYDQIKSDLPGFHEQLFELREKLEKMTLMKDFSKLSQNDLSRVKDLIEILQPYTILPRPVKLRRRGNWAEHYLYLASVETEFNKEKNKFFSLFRSES